MRIKIMLWLRGRGVDMYGKKRMRDLDFKRIAKSNFLLKENKMKVKKFWMRRDFKKKATFKIILNPLS